MPKKSYLSFIGFVVLIAATYCPLLKPFGIFPSMDIYALKQPFGITILLIGVIGILGVALRQKAITKLCAWIALILVAVFYAGVVFQIHHFFSFIPFGSVARFFTRMIKFKWGWYLLFAGPLLAVIGAHTTKKGAIVPNNKEK
jgi:hypothetical protein